MSKGRYKMGTISKLTGFSPNLLRAWERRHSLLEPVRGSGGHRLYTDDDLRVLQKVRKLLDSGLAIGEISANGRPALLENNPKAPITTPHAPKTTTDLTDPRLQSMQEALVQGALDVNRETLERTLDQCFSIFPTRTVLYQIILPSTREIGRLWVSGQCSVAGEHLVSAIFLRRLEQLFAACQTWSWNNCHILCSCFPDEQHALGTLMVSYELACLGYEVTYLGNNLPFLDLELTIQKLRPRAVCLSVTRPALYSVHENLFLDLVDRQGDVHFFLGGRGVPNEQQTQRHNLEHWSRSGDLEGFLELIKQTLQIENLSEKPARS